MSARMTFAECLAKVTELADGVYASVEITGALRADGPHVSWKAYREKPWIGREHFVVAPTPELLVERVQHAMESEAPVTMAPSEVT